MVRDGKLRIVSLLYFHLSILRYLLCCIKSTNSAITLLFWNFGNRILKEILEYERAEYGKQIVVTVPRELVNRFGRNYEEKNLRRIIQFFETLT